MPRGRLQTAQGGQRLGRFDYLTEGGMTNMQKVGSQSLAGRENFGPLSGAGYATMT